MRGNRQALTVHPLEIPKINRKRSFGISAAIGRCLLGLSKELRSMDH